VTKGYIYILINTSYPGLLKIGKSQRSPDIRANELSIATGVPNSFHVAYYLIVNDIDTAELEIHRHLVQYRESKNREFFRIPLNQSIDLIRKILKKLNIDFANHEDETYKFKFEEYTSTKDFFNDILNDEDKWEHAKLHLDKGFLIPWLKKKGEIDALINLDLISDDEYFKKLDYRLSVICYSIVERSFKFHTTEINKLADLVNLINCPFLDDNKNLEIWSEDKFRFKYLGYLKATIKENDKILYVIHFLNYYYKKFPEPKLKFIEKVIKWNINPDRFYKLNELNENNFDYLYLKEYKENNDLGISADQTMMPMDVFNFYGFGTHTEADTYLLVDVVNKYKKILNEKGFNINKKQKLDDYLIENKFVPEKLNPYYIWSFKSKESLVILESLYTKDEIDEIQQSYKLPDGLYSSLVSPDNHESFLLASVLLRFLLYECHNHIEKIWKNEEKIITKSYDYLYAVSPTVCDILRADNNKTNENLSLQNKTKICEKYPWFCLNIPKPIWTRAIATGNNLLRSLEIGGL
jgi:hypothetical protein